MPPPVSYTKYQFKEPLFTAEFDPYGRGYLVVGGGGGENRSGVANILAVLDTTSRTEITNVAQTDLSRDEDNPQSLASLPIKDGLMVLAGINSSNTDRQAGKNEHLRTFMVQYPDRKKDDEKSEKSTDPTSSTSEGSIRLAAKSTFFSPSTGSKAFQRLLRLSPVLSKESGSKRLGAIATGDASKNEIVLFNATSTPPDHSSVIARLEPAGGAEAVDLDLYQTGDNDFSLAYCTDDKVYLYNLTYNFSTKTSTAGSPEPVPVFALPRGTKPGPKPSLRCLRFLSPKHILVLQKKPAGGADLLILALTTPKHSTTTTPTASIILRHSLPKSLKVAAKLETCPLDTDPGSHARQIVIAVAGQNARSDAEVHVLSLDLNPMYPDPAQQISKLTKVSVLSGPESSWHTSNIMALSFSPFFAPKQPKHSTMSIAASTQHIHLASVSWGGSVVVDSFSLTSTPTSPAETADASTENVGGDTAPSVRWVLTTNALMDKVTSWAGVLTAALLVLLAGLLIQSYLSLTSDSDTSTSTSVKNIMSNLQPAGARAANQKHDLAAEARVAAASMRSRAVTEKDASIGADTASIAGFAGKSAAVASARSIVKQGFAGFAGQSDLIESAKRAKSAMGAGNEVVSSATDAVAGSVTSAADAAAEGVSSATAAAADATETVKEAVGKATEAAAEGVESVMEILH